MTKISGHCLCGAVKYSTDAEPAMIAVCHCTDCQRQSGSPFSVNVLVPVEEIEISGAPLKQFVINGDSGMKVTRRFCSDCGSPLTTQLEAFNNLAAIKAGTLDDSTWVKPTIQIWCDSAQSWAHVDADIDRAAANPL
ncbi:MAG: GFA family protein [Pseudomonadota bacterium]